MRRIDKIAHALKEASARSDDRRISDRRRLRARRDRFANSHRTAKATIPGRSRGDADRSWRQRFDHGRNLCNERGTMRVFLDHRLSGLERMDIDRTAVLAIHWQVDVVAPDGAMGIFGETVKKLGVIDNTAKVIAAGRTANMPIIYINVSYKPGYPDIIRNNGLFNTVPKMNCLIRGTRGAEIIPELAPQTQDYVLDHTRISSFWGTDLDNILRSHDIRTVIATGVATNVAVDHTIRDAVQLGYDAILLSDCCCSSTAEYHQAGLLTMQVLATQVTDSKAFLAAVKQKSA
ncbi:MAG: cysteine hydrolase [Alphaproteobacteria bacterium]